MLEDTLYTQLKTIGPPVIPIGPASSDQLDLATLPVPSIVYYRHSTQPTIDLNGVVRAELIDMEIMFLGNTFQESSFYAGEAKTLLNGHTYDHYEFTLLNELTTPKGTSQSSAAVVQYWNIFFAAID
jgi:hypothetical protein